MTILAITNQYNKSALRVLESLFAVVGGLKGLWVLRWQVGLGVALLSRYPKLAVVARFLLGGWFVC